MKLKRGQLSIFILFGLVILIAYGFIFYLNNRIAEIEKEVELQIASLDLSTLIKNNVDACLITTGEDALKFVGLQGGYYDKPKYSVDYKGLFYTPFHTMYANNIQNVIPSLQTIENEISKYVDNNLQNCIKDFEDIKDLGYKIESGKFSTTTSVAKDNAVFILNFPITISLNTKSEKIENFLVKIPSRLNLIYNLADEITEEQLKHIGQICLSCLIDLGDENNLYFEIVPRKKDINLIVVEDSQILIDNEPYLFIFGFNHSTNIV